MSTVEQDRITRELLEKVKEPYKRILASKTLKRYPHCNDWFQARELAHKMDAMLQALRGL